MLRRLRTLTSKIKAILFDYDGVLNDSLDVIRELYNEFYRRGITKLYFKDNQEFSDFFQGDPHKNLENAGANLTDDMIKKCDAIVKEVMSSLDKKAVFFENVDNLLLKLKNDGYKIGIVSNGYKDTIIFKLKEYGVDSAVETILGFEQVSKPKPNPEGILKCLKELGISPEEALYVGDMETDVMAAKAAGIRVIATAYGYLKLTGNINERLKDADMLAHTVEDVYEKIKNA